MDKLLQFLNSIHPLSEEVLTHLHPIIKCKKLRKGGFLLREGKVSKEIYFVDKGMLKCYHLLDGKEVNSWFMAEGNVVISIESFLRQNPSREFIKALRNTTLWYMTYDDLELLYEIFPEFNKISRKLLQHYYILGEQRAFASKLPSARERYIFLRENNPELLEMLLDKDLASYLNMSTVTFSKLKNSFINE